MSMSKIEKSGRHVCKLPIDWFFIRMNIGDIYTCSCGTRYVWSRIVNARTLSTFRGWKYAGTTSDPFGY